MRDLRYEDYDIALRIGEGSWPGVISNVLLRFLLHQYGSPEFAEKHNLSDVSKISSVPLIDLSNMDDVWTRWSQKVGIAEIQSQDHLAFNNYDYAMHAAEQGLGLALAMLPIENDALRSGKLIAPFNLTAKYDQDMYAVYRNEDKDRHDIRWFSGLVSCITPASIKYKIDEFYSPLR